METEVQKDFNQSQNAIRQEYVAQLQHYVNIQMQRHVSAIQNLSQLSVRVASIDENEENKVNYIDYVVVSTSQTQNKQIESLINVYYISDRKYINNNQCL